jgi:hypothetical protein
MWIYRPTPLIMNIPCCALLARQVRATLVCIMYAGYMTRNISLHNVHVLHDAHRTQILCVNSHAGRASHPRIRRKWCVHLPREGRATRQCFTIYFWTPLYFWNAEYDDFCSPIYNTHHSTRLYNYLGKYGIWTDQRHKAKYSYRRYVKRWNSQHYKTRLG